MHRIDLRLRCLIPVVLCTPFVGNACAQDSGTSTFEEDVSMQFEVYLAPFGKVNNASACRDICLKEPLCEGWTYYHADYKGAMKGSEELPQVCFIGRSIVERLTDMPGRFRGPSKSGLGSFLL